jgi:hypothetical protein
MKYLPLFLKEWEGFINRDKSEDLAVSKSVFKLSGRKAVESIRIP